MSNAGDRLLALAALVLICTTGCAGGVSASSDPQTVRAPALAAASGSAPSQGSIGATQDRVGSAATRSTPSGGATVTGRTRPAVPSSPLLYPHKDGLLGSEPSAPGRLTLNSSGGKTRDGQPYRPLVFTASDLWMVPSGAATAFVLEVDVGRMVGAAAQARVSYDLEGDGSWDRVETYRYFATDPKAGFQLYTEAVGLRSSQGSHGELRGGTVRLELWAALGGSGAVLDLAQSSLSLPYR